jgi:hypothetical protein
MRPVLHRLSSGREVVREGFSEEVSLSQNLKSFSTGYFDNVYQKFKERCVPFKPEAILPCIYPEKDMYQS